MSESRRTREGVVELELDSDRTECVACRHALPCGCTSAARLHAAQEQEALELARPFFGKLVKKWKAWRRRAGLPD